MKKFPIIAPEQLKPTQYAAMEGVSMRDIYTVVAIYDAPDLRTRGAKLRYKIIRGGLHSKQDALGIANTLNRMSNLPLWDAAHVSRPTRSNLASGKR